MDNETILHVLEEIFGKGIESYILTVQLEDKVVDVTYGTAMDLAFMHVLTTNTIQNILKNAMEDVEHTTLQ